MKKVTKILTFIFIAGMFFSACQKEDFDKIATEKGKPEIEFVEGRLHFNSSAQLGERIAKLKKLDETALQNEMAGLYKEGFKPLKPFYKETDFELKQEYANKKALKMKSSGDAGDDDDELIADEFFASVLNENREIQVGDSIYKYTEQGLFFCHIDDVDELELYLESQNLKNGFKKIIDPCEMDPQEFGIQPMNAYVKRYIPNPDCGGGLGGGTGGGTTGGGSSTNYGDTFINNLPECDSRNGFWQILGNVKICEDYYDSKHRVKTKYWKQKYLVFGASIGVSVKHQKKTLGIFWTTKTDEIRLGLKQIYFEYEMPVPNVQNTLPVLIAYQGKFYDNNLQIISVLSGAPQLPQLPFQDDYNIVNIWLNLPWWGYQNVTVTSKEMNKLFWDKAWGYAKDLGKKLGKPEPKKVTMVGFTSNKVIINHVNKEKVQFNDGKINHIFDWNGQITFKWTSNVNGGFQWSMPSVKYLYDYKKVKIDIYGVARQGSTWKGSRLIFTE